MTSKERWLAVFHREAPDRVPMDYWGTWETSQKLMAYLAVDDFWEMCNRLHIDAVLTVNPEYVGPRLKSGYDFYGRGYQCIDYDGGSYDEVVHHPLAEFNSIAELEASYTWPTSDWFDNSVIPAQLTGKEVYPVRGGGSEPFLNTPCCVEWSRLTSIPSRTRSCL